MSGWKALFAINLSFACSLRIGEILGLTWDNVQISEEDIIKDNASVYIDKELQRANLKAIDILSKKDIIHIFDPLKPNCKTRLVLKKPKTNSSIRRVWLPRTLAYIMLECKKSQEMMKGVLGDEYEDNNLVIPQANGKPCEDRLITESFQRRNVFYQMSFFTH